MKGVVGGEGGTPGGWLLAVKTRGGARTFDVSQTD